MRRERRKSRSAANTDENVNPKAWYQYLWDYIAEWLVNFIVGDELGQAREEVNERMQGYSYGAV